MGRKLLISAALGIVVLAVLALIGDAPRVWHVLKTFPPAYLPAILLLTSWNYLLRFGKWHMYLKRLGIRADLRDSAGIFACGLAMAITPGKAGELLKSLLLRRQVGTPIATSAPIVLSERLTDGLAVVCLAATGVGLYHQAVRPLALLVAVSLGVVV